MNRQKKDGAISEVLGTLLLLGLAVGLFSVLYIIVFSYPFSPNPPSAYLIGSIAEEGNTMTVTIENLGGSTLNLDTKIIISSGDVLKSLRAKDFAGIDINGDGYWGMGETFNYPWSDVIAGDVYVTVIDQASNSIVMSGVLPVPFLATVVNPIIPSLRTTTPLNVTARVTGDVTPDDVSLWYRFGSTWTDDFINKGNVSTYHTMTFTNGNVTANQTNVNIVDYVDNDQSNVDGSPDIGTHSNFNNEKNIGGGFDVLREGNTDMTDFVDVISNVDGSTDKGTHSDFDNEKSADGTYDTLTEKTTSNDIKDFVDSNTSNVDGSADIGTEINFPHAQGISPDGSSMTIQEANTGTPNFNELLYVNGFTSSYTQWTTHGSSPYLGNVDGTNYISTASDGNDERWFTFADTTATSGTLIVNLSIYVTAGDGDDDVYWYIDTTGDNNPEFSGTSSGTRFDNPTNGWYTRTISNLDTVTEVNAARVWFEHHGSGTSHTISIDCARLGVYRAGITNYNINFEYQWTAVNYNQDNEMVCMYFGSHTGSENLLLNYWTGSAWSSLGTISGTGWENYTATGLTTSTYTIQLRGASESGDTTQDSWQIDCMFLHDWSILNNSLDLEVQWSGVDFTQANRFLCIKTGSLDASENLKVEVRTGSTWTSLISALLPNQWNNISVFSYLTSDTFTIRYLGTIESNDKIQSSWNIDAASLHLWSLNYSLDLEVQWTSVDSNQKNEILCINMQGDNTFSLDATGGYMRIGGGTPDWGSTQGTVSFWIKWDSLSSVSRPWGQNDRMEIYTSGSHLILNWGGSNSLTSSTSFTTNKWYFIAITWDENSNDLYLYVGDQTTQPTQDTHISNWYSTVTDENPDNSQGNYGNTFMASMGSNPVDGHGDDLRYWNTDRSLANIQSDYSIELTGSETNLRSYYKLNNNFEDIGSNNNDGSGSGSYSFSSDAPFGASSTENIGVDVWNTTTSTWNNLFSNLVNGWNNASVHTWLTSSILTIRYTDSISSPDTYRDSWMIDAALLRLTSAYYQGDLTSITITKPSSSTWSTFNAEVNNTANSTFRILDQTGTPLLSNLNGDNNNISSISTNTIRLFGSFDGPVKLDSWSVSNGNGWIQYGTDTQSSDGWSWSFTFPFGKGTYWFYSIGRKIHFSDESPPVNPSYDTSCIYWP